MDPGNLDRVYVSGANNRFVAAVTKVTRGLRRS
jgi:hypothetical protein